MSSYLPKGKVHGSISGKELWRLAFIQQQLYKAHYECTLVSDFQDTNWKVVWKDKLDKSDVDIVVFTNTYRNNITRPLLFEGRALLEKHPDGKGLLIFDPDQPGVGSTSIRDLLEDGIFFMGDFKAWKKIINDGVLSTPGAAEEDDLLKKLPDEQIELQKVISAKDFVRAAQLGPWVTELSKLRADLLKSSQTQNYVECVQHAQNIASIDTFEKFENKANTSFPLQRKDATQQSLANQLISEYMVLENDAVAKKNFTLAQEINGFITEINNILIPLEFQLEQCIQRKDYSRCGMLHRHMESFPKSLKEFQKNDRNRPSHKAVDDNEEDDIDENDDNDDDNDDENDDDEDDNDDDNDDENDDDEDDRDFQLTKEHYADYLEKEMAVKMEEMKKQADMTQEKLESEKIRWETEFEALINMFEAKRRMGSESQEESESQEVTMTQRNDEGSGGDGGGKKQGNKTNNQGGKGQSSPKQKQGNKTNNQGNKGRIRKQKSIKEGNGTGNNQRRFKNKNQDKAKVDGDSLSHSNVMEFNHISDMELEKQIQDLEINIDQLNSNMRSGEDDVIPTSLIQLVDGFTSERKKLKVELNRRKKEQKKDKAIEKFAMAFKHILANPSNSKS